MVVNCWFCSDEVRPPDRAKLVADLNVLVHVGCFDRLYEADSPESWSNDRRAAALGDPPKDDHDEEASAS